MNGFKPFFIRLALLLVLLPVLPASATVFKEGVHYSRISDTPSPTPQVTEYFSFLCGNCYRFYLNSLPKLKRALPANTTLHQNHVSSLGGERGALLSKAFVIAERLGVSGRIEQELFNAIHEQQRRFVSLADIRALFVVNGISPAEFDAVADDFVVRVQMAAMAREMRKAGITGVPALVVNGQYRINNNAIGSYSEMIELAQFLLNKSAVTKAS
ncbi:thiol:disulfide interchange protein [Shewanella sp. NFH-SH190041]|uniref:thiol:disulfide interchange protein DsbA/DsbL n=1 Tax=Shewanella sp. NFH-SH190041 TaxID=2950245 RepID=UPI0021C389F4|nr:thiol:disulfide interchange protein DsbA/DsbL [Shewanella sp. NFH-SH190041]BDM66005.1 thiol:disulfide interchange protein [Shewanella sp. NFH-SH190041]